MKTFSKDTIDSVLFFKKQFLNEEYGEGHFLLACHAAFPIAFTADMLYQIWANFKIYEDDGVKKTMHYVAVSDLLLSSLCVNSARDLFEMNPEIRGYLLDELREDRRFGEKRVRALAEFLYQYVEANENTMQDQAYLDTQYWTSMATLSPALAAQKISTSLINSVNTKNDQEILRLNDLIQSYTFQADGFDNLFNLTQGLTANALNEKTDVIKTHFDKVLTISEHGKGIQIPMPPELAGKFEFAEIETASKVGHEKALERINDFDVEKDFELDLSGLGLKQLPKALFELKDLKRLNLEDNKLENIDGIGQLSNLEYLFLDSNLLKNFPDDLQKLTALRELYANLNQITAIPTFISLFKNLTILNLYENKIQFIPEDLVQLSKLEFLSLADNQITHILPDLERIDTLQEFHIQENPIKQFSPYEFKDAKDLKAFLRENYNDLTVGYRINKAKIKKETILDLVNLQLEHFPEQILELKHLEVLHLGNEEALEDYNRGESYRKRLNQIKVLPETINQLKNLKILSLQANGLERLPTTLGELVHLETLQLSGNEIAEFPTDLANLVHLKYIGLKQMGLEFFPSFLESLKNIEEIILYNNHIPTIPNWITSLPKLQSLNIFNNQIKNISTELIKLSSLNKLVFHSNPIKNIPQIILNKGTKATLSDLRDWLREKGETVEENKSIKEANDFVYQLIDKMMEYDDVLLKKVRRQDTYSKAEGLEWIVNEFPQPITYGLKDLGEFVDLDKNRLKTIVLTYVNSTRLIAYVLLADLWAKVHQGNLPVSSYTNHLELLTVSQDSYLTYPFIEIISNVLNEFQGTHFSPFIDELSTWQPKLESDGELFKAYQVLDDLRYKVLNDAIYESEDIPALCLETEQALGVFLENMVFLMNYRFISNHQTTVKNGFIRRSTYENIFIPLKGIYNGAQTEEFTIALPGKSILLMKKERTVNGYVDLTPFFVDKNNFEYSAIKTADLYHFAFVENDNYYFQDARQQEVTEEKYQFHTGMQKEATPSKGGFKLKKEDFPYLYDALVPYFEQMKQDFEPPQKAAY